MLVLSRDLSLVLAEYNELPENIQKDIDFDKKSNGFLSIKGDLHLYEVNKKYLYVSPDLFNDSLLKSVYGDRIDRTNEDSFDTQLFNYFSWIKYTKFEITEEEIIKYIEGMGKYAASKRFENLWHLLQIATQCINDSFHPNFSSLLSFYSIIELLVLKDKKGEYLGDECGRKLPCFYRNINILHFPEKLFLNETLSEEAMFKKLTKLRHKVIHGIFDEARNILDELVPNKSTNTEDAESSAFQDQIQTLNGLLRCELVQILCEWMSDPQKIDIVKTT